MAEQKILISIQVQDKAATKTINAAASSLGKLEKSQKRVAKATDQTRATSGLNNAILMETSRLASDASFGFTAIANNLSQLINLFKASKDATGSFMTSIKSLFTAQSALLIGIQLLITYGDDLFRLFKEMAGGSQLLQETFKGAGGEVQSTAGKFEVYVKTLQDSTKSQQEQADAIEGLKKEFPEYLKQLQDAGISLADVANKTEEATKQNDLYRESIIKLAMSRAAQNKIEEEAAKQVQAQIDLEIESGKGKEELIELESRYQDALAKAPKVGASRQKFLDKQFTAEEKRIIRLIKARNEEVKSAEENINKLIGFIDIQTKKARVPLPKKFFEDFEKSAVDALEDFSFNDVFPKDDKFDPNEIPYFDDMDEAIDEWLLTTGKADLSKMLLGLTPDSREKDLQALEEKFDPILYQTDEYRAAIQAINDKWDAIEVGHKRKVYQQSLNQLASFLKTAADLNEGNKDLARLSIVASSASAAIGIWDTWWNKDKTPAIGKAPLAIAGTAISYAALLASTAAALKSVNTGKPLSGGGAGGGRTIQSPDFNVVGASQAQQLAETVAGQQAKPIKAFVVGKDISTQQELDRNITNTASFG